MAQFVEAIPHLLLRVFVPALGITLVAWLIVLFVQLFSGKRHSCRAASPRCDLGKPVWVGLAALAVVCTTLCGKNTNGVQNVGGGHLFQFNPPLVQVVSPQDVSNGWRVAEETDAESFAQPSANAITNELWRRRGAFDDALRIPANGWSYPYATGVTVLARGELRTSIRAHDFPRAFAQDISLLPLVNWSQLPEGRRESIFWYDTTSSNTLLTTWWNAALGRDATNPVNFQAELFPDGGFTYRYEDRTVRHARVWPFDWDGDGLENSVDPDPLTPGPDAHGTNAEWYNTVCSNVFSAVATSCDPPGSGAGGTQLVASVELTWREGVNSNAYYFVDVVTEHGPAPIYFTGDRDSRLGNPVVVALAGITNRVPLLIGIDYAITSPVPFAVSFPVDYMYPEVLTNTPCTASIHWPLNFVFTEGIGASNRVYTVTVEPYDPGGVLEWDDSGGGVPMRGSVLNGGCECLHYGTNSVWFTCSIFCTCDGVCYADGTYALELATFPVEGGQCRCGFDDPPPDSPPSSHEPADPPSLTITLNKSAVIFEDAYEDSPGVMKPRRSTRVRLTIDAYGGPDGGSLWLTGVNLGKLSPVEGGVALPYSQELAAGTTYHVSGVYEGVIQSENELDISVSGSFYPNGQGGIIEKDARLTAVRILLLPYVHPPKDATNGRHRYGVCERVKQYQYPSVPTVTWNPVGGGSNLVLRSEPPCYQFPLHACRNPLRVDLGDVSYVPLLRCIEPTGIVVRDVELCTFGLPAGKAGGIGLLQAFYVTPFTVSFSGIAIEEVPCNQGTATGYFRYAIPSNFWSHTHDAGAGQWYNVSTSNRMGEQPDSKDMAAITNELFAITSDGTLTNDYSFGWIDGQVTWQIPFGWNARDTQGEAESVGTFGGTTQEFYIDPWGRTGVRKFKNQATRRLDDKRFLNGIEVRNNVVK